jgi:hypothetical protein
MREEEERETGLKFAVTHKATALLAHVNTKDNQQSENGQN